MFRYQEFQKSLAVATMLREYKVVKLYYRYYMLWVSENENLLQMVLTVIVIQKKGQVMQDKS